MTEMRTFAVLNSKLQVIYGIVEGRSEHDVLSKVIGDPETLLFDGRRGARRIEAREVGDLREDFWYEVASDVQSAGRCGGDVQVSDSVSRRFARPVHRNGDWAVFEAAWYICDDIRDDSVIEPRGRWLERQDLFARCGDLRDIGSTETWSDARYVTVEGWAVEEASLAFVAAEFDADVEITWSGEEFH